MSRPIRGVLYSTPPSPDDTRIVRNLPPAIAGTLEREAADEDDADSTTESDRSPEADPQLTAATTYSSLTGAPADD